ncbi:porin family protein [Vibrio atypicus]|jgi:opacity protein-like surface antigen|uniref:porin family protein n=1 Tax=Vibrio atypicus TaxID=558271 RepID=UPI00135CCACB|nr:porin family protein [Vibrio atypicus]
MKKTLLALMVMGVSASAHADSWLYAGIQGGKSNLESESSTAYGLHVGTGILPFIGLEAGYFNHGSIDLEARNTSGSADFSSFYAAAKPSIDFGPLHIYAKGGINTYNVEYTGSLSSISNDSGVGLMYGVGAEYNIFPGLTVGASYQSFGFEIDGSGNNVDSFTVNATLHFL